MPTASQVEGCYWGLALGDAIGMPVEFSSVEEIRERYGEAGIERPKDWALWTDDTEMAFAVTRALLSLGTSDQISGLDDDDIGRTFAKEFIGWFDNPGHAPGVTCMNSVNYLRSNSAESWREAGDNDSKGCGSVMRAAPLGLWFAGAVARDLESGSGVGGPGHAALSRVSQIQSEMTHGHGAATAAALAGAYAVSLAVSGVEPRDIAPRVREFCDSFHPDFASAMDRLEVALRGRGRGEFGDDMDALHNIGQGWVGEEAFAMALYAATRHPRDLEACLRVAANHSGDSDSVACIAGSIVGALVGKPGIPREWVDRLAEKSRMVEMIGRVVAFFADG
ncbi:MAG: ADP-ribosylglycohydrolase family protein [Promethearchaeota archaeon]